MNVNGISKFSTIANFAATISQEMYHEEQRFNTFDQCWPHTFVSSRILAKTGFYYLGTRDHVKCYFCNIEISRWENGDNEVNEHSRWSPNCPLLKRRETANVPLEPISELDQLLPPMCHDVFGSCGIEIRPGSYAETSFTSSSRIDNHIGTAATVVPTATNAVIQQQEETYTFKHPAYPEYAIETARLRSFAEWPKSLHQTPTQLSDAGFFYAQKGDRVICFSCGGGLRDWEKDDEPWEQHTLWCGRCDYLQLVKGEEYINAIKAKYSLNKCEKKSGQLTLSSQKTGQCENSSMYLAWLQEEQLPAEKVDLNWDGTSSDSKLCKICCSAEFNTAFMPCGHVIACTTCASAVTKCMLCRKPFDQVIRVFFS